jgi:hypothetical protein
MGKSADPASPDAITEFQRREWAVRRAGWVVLSALLAAGALGLFGQGPLARAQAGADEGWLLEYDRFVRSNTPSRLAVTLPAGRHGDTASIWIDRGYADRVEIQESNPTPLSVTARADRLIYRFLVIGGPTPIRVVFDVEPQTAGRLRGRVGIADSVSVGFVQLVYP